MPPVRNLRASLKPGEVLCSHCTAICCRYFSIAVDTPKTWEDFDLIRWYMTHGRVSLFVDDGQWYLVIHADCRYLRDDHLCGIYETRPAICRSYHTDDCEFDNDHVFEKFFECPEQIWEYAEAILPPRESEQEQETHLPVLHAH